MTEIDTASWLETVNKVRKIDPQLAEELTRCYLQAGSAIVNLISKIATKKENNA